MTVEQIKQKAEAEADKVVIGSGMNRASVIHLKHLLVTMYMQGATEATKELEEENAELRHQLNKNPCVCNTEWHCNDCLEQLTKAKNALKKFVDFANGERTIPIKWITEAEQFLSEVEK